MGDEAEQFCQGGQESGLERNYEVVHSLRQIVPDELEKDIAKSSSVLKTYDAVKKYVYEQVAVRRDVKNTSKGQVQMDLNAMMAALMTEDDRSSEEEMCEQCDDGGEYAGDNKVE